MLKRIFALLIAMVLVLPSLHVVAEEPTARILNVFRVDGENASLARSLGGRSTEPREGQRLIVGNVMTTGQDTQVYMQLDAASIVKQDEQTYVAVAEAGSNLALTVLRGSALVHVTEMEPGSTLETRIGSTVMSVRGTLFIANIREDGAGTITMLSGYGVVQVTDRAGAVVEVTLAAGNVFWINDAVDEEDFAVRPVELGAMSLFELRETYNYSEYLMQVGTVTPEMLEQLPQLIDIRQAERDAIRAAQEAALAAYRAGGPVLTAETTPPDDELQLADAAVPFVPVSEIRMTLSDATQRRLDEGYELRVGILMEGFTLLAEVYPHNATNQNIEWRLSPRNTQRVFEYVSLTSDGFIRNIGGTPLFDFSRMFYVQAVIPNGVASGVDFITEFTLIDTWS